MLILTEMLVYNIATMESVKRKAGVSPYLIVLLSLVGVIILGSFLLSLPFAHQDGQWGNYLDSIFVATSATCVTGLSTYVKGIGNELTIFGQVVMLLMIQVGGLGFVTILTFIISVFIKRLKFRDRYFLSQAINSMTVADVGKFAKRVVIIVVIAELVGFALGLPVFMNMPQLSKGEAIWKSLFTSVSAFNNAGFDLFGSTSLIRGVGNEFIDGLSDGLYYYLLIYLMVLIIIGGLSFVAIIDICFLRKKPRQYFAFTKIVLMTTLILLVVGTCIFLLTETTRNGTSFIHCLFQSVTTRTAGFASIDQNNLTSAGKTISCILMFIGGSPISTAGGIKTTTIFIIVLSFLRFLQGKHVTAFNREYSRLSILKSMTLVFLSIAIVIVAFISINALEAGNAQATTDNVLFEVFSAFGTTGLTANLTTTLTVGSKLILCLLMFFGRLGPITLFQIFEKNMEKEEDLHYKNIETDLLVG